LDDIAAPHQTEFGPFCNLQASVAGRPGFAIRCRGVPAYAHKCWGILPRIDGHFIWPAAMQAFDPRNTCRQGPGTSGGRGQPALQKRAHRLRRGAL